MGCRGQVCVKMWDNDPDVYLCTHYTAHNLPDLVRQVILDGRRIEDNSYLARIIFCQMVQSHLFDDRGFGIDTCLYTDIQVLVTVDPDKKKVVVDRTMYDGDVYEYAYDEADTAAADDTKHGGELFVRPVVLEP